jgi:hypothetical protein
MKRVVVAACLLLLCGEIGRGQELNCTVTVNTESIPSAQRDYLRGFAADVERYLNGTRFTDEDLLGEKIVCSMEIFFKGVSGANQYQAQIFVSSQRPIYIGNDKTDKMSPVLRILDDKCEFTYLPNQRMVHDDLTFDPLTDLLDYYAYIVIGMDLETYTPLSGAKYFQKASNICQQGAATTYGKDWGIASTSYNRYGLADELNNSRYNPVRVAINSYHFDGIDLLATDKRAGLASILKAVETIADLRQRLNPTSVLVKQFFDAKYKEIGDSFVGYSDPSVFDRLSTLDQEHRSYYQDRKNAR